MSEVNIIKYLMLILKRYVIGGFIKYKYFWYYLVSGIISGYFILKLPDYRL